MPGLSLVHISICGSLKRSCSSPVPCCSSSCSSLGKMSSGRSAMRVELSSVWSRSKTSNSFFLDSKIFRCCVLQSHSCIHSLHKCRRQGSGLGQPSVPWALDCAIGISACVAACSRQVKIDACKLAFAGTTQQESQSQQ